MSHRSSGEFAPWWGVFETVRVVGGKPLFFAEHRAELKRAMTALGLTSDNRLEAEAATLVKTGRWRWIVTRSETKTRFTEEKDGAQDPVAMSVSHVRLGSENWDARYKTLSYLSHAQALKTGGTPEVAMLNENGHVASASRANIFWRRGDRLFTPAHSAGCRCGVVRGFVMAQYQVEEGHFPVEELLAAEEIFVTNSMKGIVSAREIEGRKLEGFPVGDVLRERYAQEISAQLQRQLPSDHW
jgi:branched-subunit amino acid aminotransferase/4-amino-4-deoxychorismate lyase